MNAATGRDWLRELALALGLLLLAGTVVWFGSGMGWWGPEPGIMPGERAAAFVLSDLEGEPRNLYDFVGEEDRPVLLNFWATWCDPCIYEMPALQQLHDEGKALVLGVNLDDPRAHAQLFLDAYGVTYPILFDEQRGRVTSGLYRVMQLPATLLINAEGTICARVVGAPAQPYEHFDQLVTRMAGTCPVA